MASCTINAMFYPPPAEEATEEAAAEAPPRCRLPPETVVDGSRSIWQILSRHPVHLDLWRRH